MVRGTLLATKHIVQSKGGQNTNYSHSIVAVTINPKRTPTNQHYQSFLPATSSVWNNLSTVKIQSSSLEQFNELKNPVNNKPTTHERQF